MVDGVAGGCESGCETGWGRLLSIAIGWNRPRAAVHAWPFSVQNDNNRSRDGLLKIGYMAESVSSS